MKSIFLNIASYRDPELLPSITDCINRAKFPERIFFGVHEQNDQHNTSLDKIDNLKYEYCLLYTSPSPRDRTRSRMPSSA